MVYLRVFSLFIYETGLIESSSFYFIFGRDYKDKFYKKYRVFVVIERSNGVKVRCSGYM